MRRSIVGLSVVFAAIVSGCSSAPVVSSSAIGAGPEARSQGVASFQIADEAVTFADEAGTLLGTITVEVTGQTSRVVHVTSPTGTSYEAEISGPALPLEAIVEPVFEGVVLADPALSSFLKARQLSIAVTGQGVSPEVQRAASGALQPSIDQAQCAAVTFVAGCTKWNQCGAPVNNLTFDHNAGATNDQNQCASWCGNTPPNTYIGVISGGQCGCYTGTSTTSDYAACTVTSCTWGNCWYCNAGGCFIVGCTADVVKKTRTCTSGGTCSNQSNGLQWCQ